MQSDGCEMEAKDVVRLKPGAYVKRGIDDSWFTARVLSLDAKQATAQLEYLDDNNVEDGVSFADLRLFDADDKEALHTMVVKPVSTLPRPLAGLVEDDADERQSRQPRVLVHGRDDVDDTKLPAEDGVLLISNAGFAHSLLIAACHTSYAVGVVLSAVTSKLILVVIIVTHGYNNPLPRERSHVLCPITSGPHSCPSSCKRVPTHSHLPERS